MKNIRVVYSSSKTVIESLKGKVEQFPENELSIVEQLNYEPQKDTEIVVTNSPFVLAKYDRAFVQVFKPETSTFEPIQFQTYGADVSVIIKSLESEVRSLMPRSVVAEVREKLKGSTAEALEFIDQKLGDSGEKGYLKRKLQNELSSKKP